MKEQMRTIGTRQRIPLSSFAAIWVVLALPYAWSGEVNNKLMSRAAGSTGEVGNAESGAPDMTPDGTLVVFESGATNLMAGVTGHQIYLRNAVTDALELISVNSSGVMGNGSSYQAHISSDGRYVAFTSNSNNLVAGDANNTDDIFVRDRQTGTTSRISAPIAGGETNGPSFQSRISGDGRFVLFESRADNLVAGDTNGMSDGFLADRTSGTLERVTLTSTGAEIIGSAGGRNETTAMSDDGNLIVFLTDADAINVVPNDANTAQDIFLRDRAAGTTTRLSVNAQGQEGNNHSLFPSISRDGTKVAFTSFASNLVANDTNGVADIFVLNRVNGVLSRITDGNADCAQVTISADGRYVAFASAASNLVADDTNGLNDQFLFDSVTGTLSLLSRASNGTPGNGPSGSQELPGLSVFCCDAHVSTDGRFVVYDSQASNLTTGDTNNAGDVFMHDRQPSVIARAGADQEVVEGTLVNLDGSTSFGTNLTFTWEQASGPAVVGGTPNGALFSFTAPSVVASTFVVMRLIVTDGTGASSFDTVNIAVLNSEGGGFDTDFDGILDDTEKSLGTNPNDANSKPGGTADFDNDGITDDKDPDDDNDGFSDAQEASEGTNPYDATSKPTGPVSAPEVLTLKKMQIKVSFQNKGDSAKVDGVITLPAGFVLANAPVELILGGVRQATQFSDKGKATGFKLTYKKPKKGQVFAGGPGKISGSMKGVALQAGLGVANEDQKAGQLVVPVVFKLNGLTYSANPTAIVKSKKDKTATLKAP
jgi:Tol biopolymer transport system component